MLAQSALAQGALVSVPSGGNAAAASASGTGTATGVGRAIFAGVASASGVGVATGFTAFIASASGTGTATGVGRSTGTGVGSSAGVGTATGVGFGISTGDDNPTFNGTADARTTAEYMSLDGGDFFDEVADGSWDTSWHKDNAKFSIVAIIYPVGGAAVTDVFCTENTLADHGIKFQIGTTGVLTLFRTNGSLQQSDVLSTCTLNAWNFIGVSLDEAGGANASHWRVGTVTGTFDGTMASPSSSPPTNKARLMARNDGANYAPAGTRLISTSAWDRNLSPDEFDLLYHHWKTRRMGGVL